MLHLRLWLLFEFLHVVLHKALNIPPGTLRGDVGDPICLSIFHDWYTDSFHWAVLHHWKNTKNSQSILTVWLIFMPLLKKKRKKTFLKILTQLMLQLCVPVGSVVTPYDHVCHLQACSHLLALRNVSKWHLPSLQGIFGKYGHTRRTQSTLSALK